MEKITRTLWAPAAGGSGQETKWFFERARGQYADELNRERTPAKQRAFKIQFPMRQKFLKTDVAKWEHSWAQKPWLVSRGAEKNFRAFMTEQAGKKPTEDLRYVQRLIANGTLLQATQKIVTEQSFGGYRANIVTYSIAKIANATAQRIDLDRIWREQAVSDALASAIAEISHLVHKVIIEPPVGTTHVGEWTKKEACWARVVALDWQVPAALERELLHVGKMQRAKREDDRAGLTDDDAAAITKVALLSADSWFAMSRCARETGNLEAWQRSLAYSLGRVQARGGEVSTRQARQGALILDAAVSLGFKP